MKRKVPYADADRKVKNLLPRHLEDLRNSGLRDDTISASGVYSETDPGRVNKLLGGYLRANRARGLGPCLAFPFLDVNGNPMTWLPPGAVTGELARPYVRLKPDRPRKRNGKPVKYESPFESRSRLYIPPGVASALDDPKAELLIVEGEKKALAGAQDGFPTVGLSGVWNWCVKRPKDPATGRGSGPRTLIVDLQRVEWTGRRVTIVFDSDLKDKPDVELARWHLAQALVRAGADVRVVDLPAGPDAAKCGLDDFLVAHGPDALRLLLDAAKPPPAPASGGRDGRVTVRLGADEHRVNDEVIRELVRDRTVYQRGGELVRVSVETARDGGPRVSASPRIEPIPGPALRDLISRRVHFVWGGEGGEKPDHPPAWCVSAVAARGSWPGMRPLTGVVSFPVLRPDGTILTAPGYDDQTGLYLHWTRPPLPIPGHAALDDAKAAVAELLDAVGDFPFAAEMHKSAWLAALLTPLARPAFDGPAPLFLVDANVRGAGKGLSLEVISRIVTGNPFPVISYPANPRDGEEELRKKITTFLLYGDRIALFDNLTGAFGDGTLDRALTGTVWQDRVLGSNRQFCGPLTVTFFATGNNVTPHADTARRVCHVRLESPYERPEERADVTRPQLLTWVAENRERLLAGALTILWAYRRAGRPDFNLKPWGSFDSWSALVRNAVVWCGLPDPGEARLAIQGQADETARGLGQLIAALELIDPERTGRTAAEIVDAATGMNCPYPASVRDLLREAVDLLVAKPEAKKVGTRLRNLRKRVIDGKYIDLTEGHTNKGLNRWAVFGADRFHERPESRPPRPPHPRTPPCRGLDVEDVEDVVEVVDVVHPGVEPELSAGNDEEF